MGKVCLSILGTWSGPQWTTIMDISSILISIQSLLDMNPLDHEPGYFGKNTPVHHNYRDCVAYETYRTLILRNIFNIPESKIRVVYLANSLKISNEINISLPKKYILFVGQRDLYKNFDRFISSISKLLKNNKDLHIICAGGGNFKEKETYRLRDLNIEQKVTQLDLNDDMLSHLYKNALLFVFPSLYEGFGIPLLESFSFGCPVACSNISSLPEVAMDGATYFDPMDEDSIYDCINHVIFNGKLKEKLVKNAYKRLESFSWEKTANKTKEVYSEVIK